MYRKINGQFHEVRLLEGLTEAFLNWKKAKDARCLLPKEWAVAKITLAEWQRVTGITLVEFRFLKV